MGTRFVGLDLGTHAVRAAQVAVDRKGGTTLERFAQVTLPPGAVVAGEVADPPVVSASLKRLWREGGLQSKNVIVGVGNQRVVVRHDELPEMDHADLRQAIEFKADELIPIPLSEAVLGFQELERSTDDNGQAVSRVLVAAAQRDMLDSLITAVEGAGLQIDMIDLAPFGLLRSLAGADELSLHLEPTTEAIVDIGAGVTNIVVHEHGIPRFVRILMLGADSVNEGLAEVYELDGDGAESLKRQVAAGLDTESGVPEVVEERLAPLVEDIRSSIDYHLAQSETAELSRVVLTGGGARMGRIAEKLQALLGAPVELGDPFARVTIGRTGLEDRQLAAARDLAAVPLGLALAGRPAAGGVERLDLQPPELARGRRDRRQLLVTAAGVVVLAGGLGLLWFQRSGDVDAAESAADVAEADVAAIRAEIAGFGAIQTLEADVEARREYVRAALRHDVAWSKAIQEIATVMPDDTWLSDLRAVAPSDTSPAEIAVSGNGIDHTSSARWVLRLEPLPGVATMWLPTSSRSQDTTLGVGLGDSTWSSVAVLGEQALSDRTEDYLSTFPRLDADAEEEADPAVDPADPNAPADAGDTAQNGAQP